jgi:hypothetical protein
MGIIYNGGFIRSNRRLNFDPDALDFITRVELADGQPLELAVKIAFNDFVVGCKADGIWSAIKACCILCGARTLSGALIPLVGTAPTNFNFVSADYSRAGGLKGNGSTKYLSSNRANNADPQNSQHLSVYVTESQTSGTAGTYLDSGISNGDSLITKSSVFGRIVFRSRHPGGSSLTVDGSAEPTGFIGMSRALPNTVNARVNSVTTDLTNNSVAPTANNILVFARPGTNITEFTNARLAFYSIGEALLTESTGLALLEARVQTLINEIAAVL